MPQHNINLTECFEDRQKIEWLRAAAKDGFDAIDGGDYIALNSAEDLDALMKEIHAEVSVEFVAESGISAPHHAP